MNNYNGNIIIDNNNMNPNPVNYINNINNNIDNNIMYYDLLKTKKVLENKKSESRNIIISSKKNNNNFESNSLRFSINHSSHSLKQINLLTNNSNKNNINTMSLKYISNNENKSPLTLDILNNKYPNFTSSKFSIKTMGIIKAYGANTYQGTIRNYNEDRVSIIINMNKPNNLKHSSWPKVSFFGIYDGHGGKGCAEYLRDNLHKFICENQYFPFNVPEAIKRGFHFAEKDFIRNHAKNNDNTILDKSGSCAVIILLVDTKMYVANVGDSRAVMSINNGKLCRQITIDHKPNSPEEQKRIINNGGKIYQTKTTFNSFLSNNNINYNNNNINNKKEINEENNNNNLFIGPFRVLPGRLSVSRTIGDIEAKEINLGGNPNVIISEPDIFIYDIIEDNIDFFVMGCDGIFDQLNSKEIFDCVWNVINNGDKILKENNNIHSQCGKAVEFIIKSSMERKSFDNVTCLMAMFKNNFNNNNNDLINNENKNKSIQAINQIYIDKNKLLKNNKNNYLNSKTNLNGISSEILNNKNENNIFYDKFINKEINNNNNNKSIEKHKYINKQNNIIFIEKNINYNNNFNNNNNQYSNEELNNNEKKNDLKNKVIFTERFSNNNNINNNNNMNHNLYNQILFKNKPTQISLKINPINNNNIISNKINNFRLRNKNLNNDLFSLQNYVENVEMNKHLVNNSSKNLTNSRSINFPIKANLSNYQLNSYSNNYSARNKINNFIKSNSNPKNNFINNSQQSNSSKTIYNINQLKIIQNFQKNILNNIQKKNSPSQTNNKKNIKNRKTIEIKNNNNNKIENTKHKNLNNNKFINNNNNSYLKKTQNNFFDENLLTLKSGKSCNNLYNINQLNK